MSARTTPFEVRITEGEINDLRRRLRATRWPERETVGDWSQGVPLSYVRQLAGYWCDEYDMLRMPDRLNRYPQFHMSVDGLDIHFLHVRSRHSSARPLVLTHGWPGSVLEFLNCIEALTDPTAHGGEVDDAFHVVVPSLPGHGFSAKPETPGWDLGRIARAWSRLMSGLGYERFFAQGGDWGSAVTTELACHDPEHVLGVHLNVGVASPEALRQLGNLTAEDQQGLADLEHFQRAESGYYAIQSTRPQTLGYGLADSPAGQLAWIAEKYRRWSDNAISHDEMLDGVMLYWTTGTATSAARLYWEAGDALFRNFTPTRVPVAYTLFPRENVRMSERWAQTRYPDLRYYHKARSGGHFAALEQPKIFVDELRAAFRAIRAGSAMTS
jgi:epoxide hydrolase